MQSQYLMSRPDILQYTLVTFPEGNLAVQCSLVQGQEVLSHSILGASPCMYSSNRAWASGSIPLTHVCPDIDGCWGASLTVIAGQNALW